MRGLFAVEGSILGRWLEKDYQIKVYLHLKWSDRSAHTHARKYINPPGSTLPRPAHRSLSPLLQPPNVRQVRSPGAR